MLKVQESRCLNQCSKHVFLTKFLAGGWRSSTWAGPVLLFLFTPCFYFYTPLAHYVNFYVFLTFSFLFWTFLMLWVFIKKPGIRMFESWCKTRVFDKGSGQRLKKVLLGWVCFVISFHTMFLLLHPLGPLCLFLCFFDFFFCPDLFIFSNNIKNIKNIFHTIFIFFRHLFVYIDICM